MSRQSVSSSLPVEHQAQVDLRKHSFGDSLLTLGSLTAVALTLVGCGSGSTITKVKDSEYDFSTKNFPEQLANFAKTNTHEHVLTATVGRRCGCGAILGYSVFTEPKATEDSTVSSASLTTGSAALGNSVYRISGGGASARENLSEFIKANRELNLRAMLPYGTRDYVVIVE